MIVYIFAGVFLTVGMYLIVQRIRCNMAVKEKVYGHYFEDKFGGF